jgi:hypothetical protein
MNFEAAIGGWKTVGRTDDAALREARLQAHWAAQCLAAAGSTLAAPQPDDSHTSAGWLPELRGLAGGELPGGYRAALLLPTLTLALLQGDEAADQQPLDGHTLAEALDWLADAVERRIGSLPARLARPTYELAPHPIGSGERFRTPGSAALEELTRWYENAARFLENVGAQVPGESPVRCWPHHFDIATLIRLDPTSTDPETAPSIGVGLSPGDDSYGEPYFYVSPWPPPDPATLPSLEGPGHWHTRNWVGAVLPASRITSSPSPRHQAQRVAAHLAATDLPTIT